MVAARAEIGDIPPVRHPRVRARCERDLELFGWLYCRVRPNAGGGVLQHRASPLIRERLVRTLQEVIFNGGQFAVMYTRGAGKTTWMTIALVWAIVFGHRHFPVAIAANGALAKSLLKTVYKIIEDNPYIAADFPAVALPVKKLNGVPQRAASQTYHGEPTQIETASMHFRLPTLRDETGAMLDAGNGALMASVGIGGSVRGLLDMGRRPDLVLFDDPQTKKDAASPSRVDWIESFIHQDALGLAGHTGSIAAVITITPQRFGDVAMRISNHAEHPEWSCSVQPFIEKWGDGAAEAIPEFIEAYREDVARDDFLRTRSREWYTANQSRFAGTETIDPAAFDSSLEVDSIHHALCLMARVGEAAWNAEYMMRVDSEGNGAAISVEEVQNALNGAPEFSVPPGMDAATAFCDINIGAGEALSYCVVAFGAGRMAAVVHYGRWPRHGALCAPGCSDVQKRRAVASGMRAVVELVKGIRLRSAETGRAVQIRVLGFDRGYLPDTVCRALFVMRRSIPLPFQLAACRGYGWRQFGGRKEDIVRGGDHVFATRSDFGEYLAIHAPYWREVAQSGFHETPLTPGSTSIYGADPAKHWDFAQEVAAERLVRKYVHPSGKLAWDWSVGGANHWCDCLTGCFALASWFRLYDALPRVVDAPAIRPPSLDLFDPRQNAAICDANGWAPFDAEYNANDAESAPAPSRADASAVAMDVASAARIAHLQQRLAHLQQLKAARAKTRRK